MNIFLNPGVHCYYVPEYADRSPIPCTVLRKREAASVDGAVFEMECGATDNVLPKKFFVEVDYLPGVQSPDKVTAVRTYTKEGAWLVANPSSETDIVELGFVCTRPALRELFPQITVPNKGAWGRI